MPYIKGLYDSADSVPGYRIAYLVSISVVDSIARLCFWGVMYAAFGEFSHQSVLRVAFVFAALCSMGIMLEKFEALNEK